MGTCRLVVLWPALGGTRLMRSNFLAAPSVHQTPDLGRSEGWMDGGGMLCTRVQVQLVRPCWTATARTASSSSWKGDLSMATPDKWSHLSQLQMVPWGTWGGLTRWWIAPRLYGLSRETLALTRPPYQPFKRDRSGRMDTPNRAQMERPAWAPPPDEGRQSGPVICRRTRALGIVSGKSTRACLPVGGA